MQLNCGIVGLPNVGKSTIFSALTSAPAEVANYPFCTIEPNVGVVSVPDKRLYRIAELIPPQKITPAITEFVDIAGLVKGASKGEGLGNQFLGHIRQVGAIVHVVRCFEDQDIAHVSGRIDPVSDIQTIEIELALADLETVQKRKDGLARMLKNQDKKVRDRAAVLEPLLDQLITVLEDGRPARSVKMDEHQIDAIYDMHLITMKKQLFCCNVDESGISGDSDYVRQVRQYAGDDDVLVICGKIESEIAALDTIAEKREFLNDMGLDESGLDRLIRTGYRMLDMQTFFTAGEKEVRAWTFRKGSKAPQAASVIHTDFERGFIKAEIYHCEDLFELGTEQKIKEAGRLRIEGKEYVVQDGDVVFFRFNV